MHRRGERSAKDYWGLNRGQGWQLSVRWNFATEIGWGDAALQAIFFQGLNANGLTELANHYEESSLDNLIRLSIHLDNLLLGC